jgi:hypothetical protein
LLPSFATDGKLPSVLCAYGVLMRSASLAASTTATVVSPQKLLPLLFHHRPWLFLSPCLVQQQQRQALRLLQHNTISVPSFSSSPLAVIPVPHLLLRSNNNNNHAAISSSCRNQQAFFTATTQHHHGGAANGHNGRNSEKKSTTMGFTKQVLREGNGVRPTRGQTVTVHCTGYGKNRDLTKKFWSTKDPGQEPFSFVVGLGQVIVRSVSV